MKWRKLTGIMICVFTAIIVVYDIFAYRSGVEGATISRFIYDHTFGGAAWYPYFWMGLFCHFQWPTFGHWNIKLFVFISIPFLITLFIRVPLISDLPLVSAAIGGYCSHKWFGMVPTQKQLDSIKYFKKIKIWWYKL